ncbi:hypothetical protein [Paenibacillus sp. 598K]|uniref:hypothetical protein n=1 Tax=Paenibacillus sp. 598K TaxID=1117987 RepID=UPI000FFE71BC|nr:hypothetical protein [Paenibacillus sp. 598K]
MTTREAVLLKPFERPEYAYQKLSRCRGCGAYTVLREEECPACHKRKLIPIEEEAAARARQSMWFERLVVLVFGAAAVYFAGEDVPLLALALGGGILSLVLLWRVQLRMLPGQRLRRLAQLFEREGDRVIHGLMEDREDAIAVFRSGDKPRTYEMLREIGYLMRTDPIKMEQVLLLQTFILRKDMDLMLEPLLMDQFNVDLAAYIGEIARLRKDLIKEKTLRYVMVHEAQFRRMEDGEEILTLVASAAVRRARYVKLYPHLLLRYAHRLPRDRFMRLYRIIAERPAAYRDELVAETYRVYKEKYQS